MQVLAQDCRAEWRRALSRGEADLSLACEVELSPRGGNALSPRSVRNRERVLRGGGCAFFLRRSRTFSLRESRALGSLRSPHVGRQRPRGTVEFSDCSPSCKRVALFPGRERALRGKRALPAFFRVKKYCRVLRERRRTPSASTVHWRAPRGGLAAQIS
jgi:hypothetical protein